jgi:GTP-binding protein HflX
MAHATIEEIEERCLLVGVIHGGVDERLAHEYLDELAFLAETAGARAEFAFTQKLPFPNPRTYVGEGKLQEIKMYADTHNIDAIIFDDELSPSQLRNIERELNRKIIDRSILILDIFAKRARTFHAKLRPTEGLFSNALP